AEKAGPQIAVDHLLEQLERGLRERRSRPTAGAVHGSPDGSMLLQGALVRRLDLRLHREVRLLARQGDHGRAAAPQPLDHRGAEVPEAPVTSTQRRSSVDM